MSKIRISGIILVGFLILLSTNNVFAISFVTAPYLQHLTANEVTIMWVVDVNDNYGWVMYGDNNQQDNKAVKIDRGMLQAYSRVNKVTIKDLQPGTTYSYKIFSREITVTANTNPTLGTTIESAVYTFTTPGLADTHTSAVIFNDTHNDSEIITRLIKLPEIPDYDFVFFNGDMLDAIPDENTILNNLIIPCADIFASSKPFMTIRGNHETRNLFARNYFDYFRLGENNQGYYTFTRGSVFFIALDSGEDKEDDNIEYSGLNAFVSYREKEAVWLKEQMESDAYKQALYKVVFMHIPTYTNTSVERFTITNCRTLFEPLFNEYKIDALISGHTHKSGILLPDGNHQYPIIIGGGYKKTIEASTHNATVITLTADQHLLDINIYDYGGRKLNNYSVSK